MRTGRGNHWRRAIMMSSADGPNRERLCPPSSAIPQGETVPASYASTFPGYRGKRLEKIDWDDWFDTFDKRKLVFLYQEHKRDGSPSTFFKLAA